MGEIRDFLYTAGFTLLFPVFLLVSLLTGEDKETMDCPVCGGTMINREVFPRDPYWDANFHCKDCNAVCDGRVIHTDAPKEEWVGNAK